MSRARVLRAVLVARASDLRWRAPGLGSRAALERHQRRRVRRHLAFLRRRSPWFGGAPRELSELPIMDKATMMRHFDELVTVPLRRDDAMGIALAAEHRREVAPALGDLAVGLSSGTSGHRGLFVTSGAERDAWAGTMLALAVPRPLLRRRRDGRPGHRIALVLRAGNALYDTVGSRSIAFRWFDLAAPVDRTRSLLGGFRPTVLVAPPSALLAIADASDAGTAPLRPERVIAVAEVLHDRDADRIASAFGVPIVHQLYQCTEGFLARTCERGTLHLNEEYVLIEREPLDERRFVPVVTDFSRRTQPIVRYRLNDVLLARADPCPCGSATAAIERIEGREEDALLLGGVRVFGDLVARAMVRASGFEEWRVVQRGPAELEVQLDDLRGEAGVRAELELLWDRVAAPAPRLEFTAFTNEPSRKLRRVERRWREDADAPM